MGRIHNSYNKSNAGNVNLYDGGNIKSFLLERLKEESCLWSYDPASVSLDKLSDTGLLDMTMRPLDIEEINLLFQIYSFPVIKKAWKENLVPEGEYLFTLNRFFAWYYFKAKRPESYLKSIETRRLSALNKL